MNQDNNFNLESTSQQNNIDTNINVNNTIDNGVSIKRPKKGRIGLVIGGISTAAVIAVVVLFFVLSGSEKKANNNVANDEEQIEVDSLDEIREGTIELTMTSETRISRYDENIIFYQNYEYFQTTDENNKIVVLDNDGKQILPIEGKELSSKSSSAYKYLGDGYFIYNTYTDDKKTTAILVKDGKLILSLDEYSDGIDFVAANKCRYKNGILYAGVLYENITIAYDVKNKKELWRTDGTFIDGYVLDDDFIRVQTSINPSGDNTSFIRDPNPNTILDYNGNKIISGADIKPIVEFGRDTYDTQIYTSKANTYLEVKKYDYVKVYDLQQNLKTSISIKETDKTRYLFRTILYSGSFIIEECQKEPYSCKDILYNENGEVILTSKNITAESYANAISGEYILSKNMDLISTTDQDENNQLVSSWVLIKDGKIAKKFKECEENLWGRYSYGLKDDYLFCRVEESENSVSSSGSTHEIINLNTLETITAPATYVWNKTKISNQSPTGKYVIFTDGTNYFVYDNKFNLKYENNHAIRPVNDKYVIATKDKNIDGKTNTVLTLINIETGKETELDVKGEYYTCNAKGLVTKDESNYYLYKFK